MRGLESGCGLVGNFRLRTVDPETGLVVVDTGWKRNVVTKYGVELLLYGFGGGTGGIGIADKAIAFGLGNGVTGGYDYYTAQDLDNELGFDYTPYARVGFTAVTGNVKTIEQTLPASPSHEVFSGTFASGFIDPTPPAYATVTEIGLFNDLAEGGGYLLCGTRFTGVPVTSTQIVQVTYTLTLSQ